MAPSLGTLPPCWEWRGELCPLAFSKCPFWGLDSLVCLWSPQPWLRKVWFHRKLFVSAAQNRWFFKKPASVFTLSYSGLSPANDTGAKKKKKKQKKKKEKSSETDSAQDQPVKVTRRLCFLGPERCSFRRECLGINAWEQCNRLPVSTGITSRWRGRLPLLP